MIQQPRRLLLTTCALFFTLGLTLAACSSSGSTTGGGTSTTPVGSPNATDILNHAKQAPLKDATFAMTLSAASASAPIGASPTLAGTGRLTTNPARTDLTLSSIQLQGVTTSAEVIIDQTSKAYYLKVPLLNQWVKFDPTALGVDIGIVNIVNYDGLQNLAYIGTDTINGSATWHIQGSLQISSSAAQGSATDMRTEDLWFRQSDYYPMKITIQDAASATTTGTPTPAPTSTGATPTATPTTGTPPSGTVTPTPTITLPGSIAHDATATPATTSTPTATGTGTPTAAQATLTETFTFSAWDSGFTITLPTTSNSKSGA